MIDLVFTPGMTIGELIDSDFDNLAKIIANRAKNMVLMTADKNARYLLNELKDEKLIQKNMFTLRFEVTLLHNDIVEILGGLRRK